MKFTIIVLTIFVTVSSVTTHAQFIKGVLGVGPVVGFGNGALGNPILFGVEGEYALTKKNEAGPGILGAGLSVDYFSESFLNGGTSTYIPVSAFVSYHLGIMMDDPRLDPYFKVGLTARIQTASATVDGKTISNSETKFIIPFIAGVQYYIERNMAIQIQLGAGAQLFSAGVKFGL